MTAADRGRPAREAVARLAALAREANELPPDAQPGAFQDLAFRFAEAARALSISGSPDAGGEPSETCPTCGAPVELLGREKLAAVLDGQTFAYRYVPPRAAAGKIDVGRWVMRDSDEETGVPFWYCDYCDNSGDALLTVAHSADCPVGALAVLAASPGGTGAERGT